MRRTFCYEEMTPAEFAAAVKEMPVFVIPTGLLEWHGEHLPLGQDALKVYGICKAAMRKLGGGILLPPNYWGRPGYSTYLGTLTFSEEALAPLFAEIFEQLVKVGAGVILLVTGHYGPCQVEFVKKVAADFQAKHPGVVVIARPEYENVLVDGQTPADHAGKFETSMFWYLYPDLTLMDRFECKTLRVPKYEHAPHDYYKEPADWEWREDLSRVASRELGRRCVEAISDELVRVIREALAKVR